MIRKLYPNGKSKAVVLTYDDGVLQDVRLVLLLNCHGLRGSFYLNSVLMEQEFCWQHGTIGDVRRLPPSVAAHLYEGHEVGSHGCTHPNLEGMGLEGLYWELGHDKWLLEQLTGQPVSGFGVPFDYYDDTVADCARQLGFRYARGSEETLSYAPIYAPYRQNAGMFHLNPGLGEFIDGFFASDLELANLILIGHSYDLDAEDLWDTMDGYFARFSGAEDVANLTHGELVDYLAAMEQAEVGETIVNHSSLPLWFAVDGEIVRVDPEMSQVV